MHGMMQLPCNAAWTLQGRHIRVRRTWRRATQLEFPRTVHVGARGVHSRGGSALSSRVPFRTADAPQSTPNRAVNNVSYSMLKDAVAPTRGEQDVRWGAAQPCKAERGPPDRSFPESCALNSLAIQIHSRLDSTSVLAQLTQP